MSLMNAAEYNWLSKLNIFLGVNLKVKYQELTTNPRSDL